MKPKREVFKVLAHAIYGSGKYNKLIIRNFWKFIQLHDKEEESRFIPFLGNLNNNTTKWISTWSMMCVYIKNRDLRITTYELDIIAKRIK